MLDPALELLLENIRRHEDEQIAALKAENEELRKIAESRKRPAVQDRWGEYEVMTYNAAYGRLYRGRNERAIEELDQIAAEG